MAAVLHICKLCGKDIRDHKERALLHTKAKDILPVLQKLFSEKGLDLSELASASSGPYLCRSPCLNELRRLPKLKQEVESLTLKLDEKLTKAYNVAMESTGGKQGKG